MMKKLCALLLSVIMAVSLAAPAFAADASSAFLPEVTSDKALGIIGGADGPTAILTSGTAGMGSVLDSLGAVFVNMSSSLAEIDPEKYLADHPGLEEQLKAGAYDFFAQQYGAYWTAKEYMEMNDLTEEEFVNLMVYSQAFRLMNAEAAEKALESQKAALGGVPGQIGVMINGAYVQFPDAAPEVANDRTMVPVRALVEALGGEVTYDDGRIVCKTDKAAVTLNIGSDKATVDYPVPEDGDEAAGGDIQMDCAPYIKGGRTYVPVRFISEALGYTVGWDNKFETAILLDRAALAAGIDKDFTILNRVQAAANPTLEEGKSWSVDMKGNATVTIFDTLNGNQTYKADLTTKALVNTEAANGSCSITISDNAIDAFLKQVVGASTYADDEDVELLRSVLTGLKDMEVIMTREGLVWAHAPILDELSGQKNVWGAMDMGAEMGAMMFQQTDAATVGSALASMVSGSSVTEMIGFSQMVKFMDQLYGDSKFKTSGGTSTVTIGVDELMSLYEDMGIDPGEVEDEIKDAFKEYKIIMKVDSRGGITVTEVMETSAQQGVPGIKMTMDCTQSGGRVNMTMKIHVANMGELALTLTANQRTTSDAPKTEPPEDANIIEADAPATLPLAG